MKQNIFVHGTANFTVVFINTPYFRILNISIIVTLIIFNCLDVNHQIFINYQSYLQIIRRQNTHFN